MFSPREEIVMWLFVATLMLSCQRSETGECNGKLAMASKRIQDIDVKSSSELSSNHAPAFARLDGPRAWCSAPGDKTPYVQITWDEEKLLTAMETQGSVYDFSWARRYEVRYLTEEGEWTSYKKSLIGNRNSRSLKKNYFKPAIRTQSVQIYPKNPFRVLMYSSAPVVSCLRLELYGCSAPVVISSRPTPSTSTMPDWETFKIKSTTTVPETVVISSRPTPSTSTRPGICPVFEAAAECPEEVDNFCTDDSSCPNSLKCCHTGCELDCVVPDLEPLKIKSTTTVSETVVISSRPTPSTSTVPDWETFKIKSTTTVPETVVISSRPTPSTSTRPGICPVFEAAAECPEEVDNFCTDDSSCPNRLKCCHTGCELDCVVPDLEPLKIKSTTTVPETVVISSRPTPSTSTGSV